MQAHGSQRLILLPGRDPLWRSGGAESYLAAHGRAARMAGYAPHVFALAERSEVLETDFGTLHRVGCRLYPKMMLARLFRRALVDALERFLAGSRGPHVLHAYGGWADAAVAASRLLGRRGIACVPVVTVFSPVGHESAGKLLGPLVRGSLPLRAWYELEHAWTRWLATPVERRAVRASAAVVVNYESVRRLVERAYGPRLAVRVLPYTVADAPCTVVDPPAVVRTPPCTVVDPPAPGAALAGRPDPPLIVSVSRHDARKGLDVLLLALSRLRSRGVRFGACLVGPGRLLGAHRRLARKLGLADLVLMPGRVAEIGPYLAAAEVFVLPSLQEGSGSLAVIEAMRAGVPIVASAIDGVLEDLDHGRTALLVPPGDPAALAGALARLLGDAELRIRLASSARALAERRFSAQAMADAHAELYAELGLAPAPAPARQPDAPAR